MTHRDRFTESEPEPLEVNKAIVDWSAAMEAPLLYDLGCLAVITRHDPRLLAWFLDGYRRGAPEIADELGHLNAFVKLWWMCNAIHFATRLDREPSGAPDPPQRNEIGLAGAYAGLTAGAAERQAAR